VDDAEVEDDCVVEEAERDSVELDADAELEAEELADEEALAVWDAETESEATLEEAVVGSSWAPPATGPKMSRGP